MDRLQGAPEALAFLMSFGFAQPSTSFDAAFTQ
ncbi:AP endonuclease family 2 C terminus [Cryobacterium levicorallinum]|uniref:AP endonuclease family 2 C terminus n=1 Tax=Cryobacterium levicorallinum TaxID=995038 RepID=A0ABY1EA34_9MICO|nr:AP endonuclease family 2 C terminus [Cryobacterium levicorallinum]